MLRVLLADADEDVLEVLRLCLEEVAPAASVMSVSMGDHAARAMADRRFDFAIFDTSLPQQSGFELARRATGQNLPVLLMSAGPDSQIALDQFGFPHLRKPFGLQKFVDEVRRLRSAPAENIRRLRAALTRMQGVVGAVCPITSCAA